MGVLTEEEEKEIDDILEAGKGLHPGNDYVVDCAFLAALVRRLAGRVEELEAFRDDAFEAHPNLDLDIDIAARPSKEGPR